MQSFRGIQRGIDPAQLEEDQGAPRWLFPCHTYHDHSNHDGSDTDQVELPGEELIDFFVAVRILRQRHTSQPACFPLTHPQHQERQVSFPLVPLMSPGLPARLHPSAPVSPLKQEQQRKNQKGIFNTLLHHP